MNSRFLIFRILASCSSVAIRYAEREANRERRGRERTPGHGGLTGADAVVGFMKSRQLLLELASARSSSCCIPCEQVVHSQAQSYPLLYGMMWSTVLSSEDVNCLINLVKYRLSN